MDTQVFKILDIEDDRKTTNKLVLETLSNFRDTLNFLRSFAKFLSIYKGETDYEFVMAKDLAEISSHPKDNEDSNVCVIFNFQKGFQLFKSTLPENININYCVLESFSHCLTYIINLIRDEAANVSDIYGHFVKLISCIFVFSETSVILNTKVFKNSVSFFIADLTKILTGNEFSMTRPNCLEVCNLISKMLTDLAKSKIYRDLILRQILKRIKCALSYSKVNQNFDGYIASQTVTFEYFLCIIKTTLNDSCDIGSNLDDKLMLEMRELLEDLNKCFEKKYTFVLVRLLESVLTVL